MSMYACWLSLHTTYLAEVIRNGHIGQQPEHLRLLLARRPEVEPRHRHIIARAVGGCGGVGCADGEEWDRAVWSRHLS